MSVLVDTNVLLRRTQPGHPHYEAAVESVARIIERGEARYFTLQNMAEFWVVATRPVVNNGLGYSTEFAASQIVRIEGFLQLLPDTPEVYREWRRLVTSHSVSGVKAHDARLAAVARVHRVDSILTFNLADFKRFGVGLLDPAQV